MQPYAGQSPTQTADPQPEQQIHPQPEAQSPPVVAASGTPQVHPLIDLRNILLIASGWIIVLLLLPPQHEYPIIDDWIYAGSVRHMLDTGTFEMPQQSQANLVGLTVCGAGWAKVLGFTFTTLTYSTLFFSFVSLFTFYALLRSLGVSPARSLFGTALLAYNPLFVHLSYSFMTDVPFLALMLLSCLLYVRALQGHSWFWLLPAGFLAGWSFLIRQFGVIVPAAFFAYLALDSLLTRKLRWRDMIGTIIVPVIMVGAWYIWSRGTPTTATSVAASGRAANFIMREPWLRVILLRSLVLLPLAALSAWTAIKIRRARWWLIALSAGAVLLILFSVDLPSETWTQVGVPDYTAHLGPIDINFSNELFTFGLVGNIIRVTGIDFFEYSQESVLTPDAWRVLWIVGLVLGILLLARMADASLDWLADRRARRPLSPAFALYLLGAGIFIISVAILGDLFDRYMFTFLPFVIIVLVRASTPWGRLAWTYSLVALALITIFTLLAKADNIDHDNARWQAAQWLSARVGAVHAGFDYDNWMGQYSDTYVISDIPSPNLRVEQRFPYFSRLGGFTYQDVLAESRNDMPPLPTPPQPVP